jgi:hypothetical protein
MKKFYALALAIAFVASQTATAQRYLTPQFSAVTKTTIVYGYNATVLTYSVPTIAQAVTQPLAADVYTPTGDTQTDRPVVVYWHSGNFLPTPQNGGVNGKRDDLTAVEVCTRLAKMGYVAISADYRLGWNPTSADQTIRTATLINAAYRGVQDCNTMSKFIKKNVAEQANSLGVDPNKVCMFGHGTGGYIVYAASTLDTITETYLPKFFSGQFPMVIEPVNGDVQVSKFGVVPAGFPGLLAGDTLNIPNHVGYSSKFQMGFTLGGAMGDTSWINKGKGAANVPPIASFHSPTDPYAPYDCGVLIVPGYNYPVVEVCGGHTVQKTLDKYNVNKIWKNNAVLAGWPLSTKANSEGITALFNTYKQTQNGKVTDSPWDIWAWNNPNTAPAPPTPPAGLCDSVKARIYIDTILGYFAPRAFIALNLGTLVGTNNLDVDALGLEISPNPATESMTFSTTDKAIQSIYLYDLQGRLVKAHVDIENTQFVMPRNTLNAGLYFAEIRFAEGVVTKKIMFN